MSGGKPGLISIEKSAFFIDNFPDEAQSKTPDKMQS